MNVVETAGNGVVNHETIFRFSQQNNLVTAKYAGGGVKRGYLVGRLDEALLRFKYAQEHSDGKVAGGESQCDISIQPDGKVQLVENFDWEQGQGQNILQELD